jgi:small basic protein
VRRISTPYMSLAVGTTLDCLAHLLRAYKRNKHEQREMIVTFSGRRKREIDE